MNILCGFLIFGLAASASVPDHPELTISQGTLSGKYINTISKKKISAFWGIPYARPPIKTLRFKQPFQASPWSGTLNATILPNACLQYSHFIKDKNSKVIGSEDCLYLNVFTPKTTFNSVSKSDLLDVIFYIHGGAFMFHTSSAYGPQYLLDKDVILVTVNYRLGPLGFLSTEDKIVPGNNGLKDQLLALKWVQNNIQQFGGDPKKVTIAGMSAGGSSVHYHMLSPRSKGLFSRAIILSGSALCPWSQTENSKEKAILLANKLGCPTFNTSVMVECLREQPAEKIVQLSNLLMFWLYLPFSPFGPVVEPKSPTAFIDTLPSKIIIKRMANDVPLLISVTSDEGLYPGAEILGSSTNVLYFNQNLHKILPHLLDFNFTVTQKDHIVTSELIRQNYIKTHDIALHPKRFIKMIGDRLYNVPVAQTAKLHSKHYSSPVYAYRFSFKGPIGLTNHFWPKSPYNGTSHADDLSYILKSNYIPLHHYPYTLPVSKKMTDIWITFIKDGRFPPKWRPVREGLPSSFSFLDINGADYQRDRFIREEDFGEENFWKVLNIKEDNDFYIRIQDEL